MSRMRTKVYLATSDPDRFAFLTSRFGESLIFTEDPDEADLMIVDLHRGIDPHWVRGGSHFETPKPIPPPFLLTAIDGEVDESLFGAIKRVFSAIGPVHKDQQELEDALAHFQSIFPVYNRRNLKNVLDEVEMVKSQLLLQAMQRETVR